VPTLHSRDNYAPKIIVKLFIISSYNKKRQQHQPQARPKDVQLYLASLEGSRERAKASCHTRYSVRGAVNESAVKPTDNVGQRDLRIRGTMDQSVDKLSVER